MAETAVQKKARLAAASQKSDNAILKALQTFHPQWAQWIIDNPQLKKTILAWAKIPGGPTPEQITAATYSTKLVQEYNTFQQRLDQIKATAPGQYKYEADQAGQAVDLEVQKQGVPLNPADRQKLVDAYQMNGWTSGSADLSRAVGAYLDVATATKSGGVQAEVDSFATIAATYGIPLPKDPTALNDFLKSFNTTGSEQGFTAYAKEQAKGLYPWMSGAIDAGVTPKQYLSPYITTIANTLNVPPASINIQDPKWASLFTKPDPSKPGVSQAANFNDIMKTVKNDPQYRYDYTPEGRNQAADFAAQLKQQFGY
jgi:hypothetical protein